MTEIHITDPDPDPERDGRTEGGDSPQESAPYKNLFVPLIVVPALIVMVLVVVYALFGAILGEEPTPRENVARLLRGGVNERQQAAFSLVEQFLASRSDEEGAADWELDPGLLPEIQRAHRSSSELTGPGDVPPYLALTLLLVWLDDPQGIDSLAEMTWLPENVDPEGVFRSYAAYALGNFGEGFDAREREAARRALLGLLEADDPVLRVVSIGALQTLPGKETEAALEGLLDDPALEVRGSAALSLAHLGSDAGEAVLNELALSIEPYEAERRNDPEHRKWSKGRDISESRQKALAALDRLDRLPPEEELLRLAEEDADGDVRALARRLLADARDRG